MCDKPIKYSCMCDWPIKYCLIYCMNQSNAVVGMDQSSMCIALPEKPTECIMIKLTALSKKVVYLKHLS